MPDIDYTEMDDQCLLERGEGHGQQVLTMRIIADDLDAVLHQGQCDRDGDGIDVRCATSFIKTWSLRRQ